MSPLCLLIYFEFQINYQHTIWDIVVRDVDQILLFCAKIYTPSVPIYKHHLTLKKGCLYIGTEGVVKYW